MLSHPDRELTETDQDESGAAAVVAIRAGDTVRLASLLEAEPSLARARVATCHDEAPVRSLLHIATDWPGHYPAVESTIALLADSGADPNARLHGDRGETPLHWAASSGDVVAIDALLTAGADIDQDGASIAGGTALTLATAFGLWGAAHHLVALGATSGLWESATLGQLDRLHEIVDAEHPTDQALTGALWGACHGGQLDTARYLQEQGADPEWLGWDDLTPLGAAQRSGAAEVVAWLDELV
jgi:ankyrin repeat protein